MINNKYRRVYNDICSRGQHRQLTGYTEVHHILPRSLGGSEDAENLTTLTAREHFIVHKLLLRFTTGQAYYKMVAALVRMVGKEDYRKRIVLTSREYDWVQQLNSVMVTTRNNRLWQDADYRARQYRSRRARTYKLSIAEKAARDKRTMTGSWYECRASCRVCRIETTLHGLHSHIRQSNCFGIRQLPKRPLLVHCRLCRKELSTNGLTNHYRFSHKGLDIV
jgi:hypothetical protein